MSDTNETLKGLVRSANSSVTSRLQGVQHEVGRVRDQLLRVNSSVLNKMSNFEVRGVGGVRGQGVNSSVLNKMSNFEVRVRGVRGQGGHWNVQGSMGRAP